MKLGYTMNQRKYIHHKHIMKFVGQRFSDLGVVRYDDYKCTDENCTYTETKISRVIEVKQ